MNEFSGYAVKRGGQLMHPDLLRKLLRYDPETGKLFWLHRSIDLYPGDKKTSEALVQTWNAAFAGKEAFTATNNQGYNVGRIFDRGYLAHQIIFAIVEGRFAEFIDHVSGDRADNRWINLREATRAENQRNMKIPSHNTSGIMGVSQRHNGKWRAQIHIGGKGYHLGLYSTKEDAITARRAAEKILGFHKNHGRSA